MPLGCESRGCSTPPSGSWPSRSGRAWHAAGSAKPSTARSQPVLTKRRVGRPFGQSAVGSRQYDDEPGPTRGGACVNVDLDNDIDRLYVAPREEFVRERDALVRTLRAGRRPRRCGRGRRPPQADARGVDGQPARAQGAARHRPSPRRRQADHRCPGVEHREGRPGRPRCRSGIPAQSDQRAHRAGERDPRAGGEQDDARPASRRRCAPPRRRPPAGSSSRADG